ncbi:MAG: peptidoglycan DD-metalloendopeptidase family protein [Desulfitobacteriaceae bacterium]
MKNKYTFLFIPPGNGPIKQFQMNKRGKFLLGASFLGLGLLVSGLIARDIYLSSYIKTYKEAFAHVDQLQGNLLAKDQEIAHLQEQSGKMTENLNSIQALEIKIAGILKLQPPQLSSTPSRGLGAAQQSYNKNTDSNSDLMAKHQQIFQQYYDESIKYKNKLDHTPSILPLSGEITSPFGYRRNPFGGWSSEFHDGVDIACSYGTEVRSTADGIVTFAGWDVVYGRKVEIDNGYGLVTFYGHNSRLIVKEGDKVKKGEVIAYSGNSGRSTGSHLHYGAIVNGKSVDPLMFTNGTKEQ